MGNNVLSVKVLSATQSSYRLVSPVEFSSNNPFAAIQGGLRDLRRQLLSNSLGLYESVG